MNLSTQRLTILAQRAASAANEAARYIATQTNRAQTVERKDAGDSPASQVVTAVDREAQRIIESILLPDGPEADIGFLAEESEDDASRLEKPCFWCIDPLDGTLPFIQGEPGFATSIALVSKAGEPLIGAIQDPIGGDAYLAIRGQGVLKNGQAFLPPPPGERLTLFGDLTMDAKPETKALIARVQQVAQKLGYPEINTRFGGGAVMNACWVLESAPACYLKAPKASQGGGCIWDFAATAALFHEAGSIATAFDGEPLDLNNADTLFMNRQGVLYATDPQLAEALRL